jgi:hypothetical protein
MEAKKSRKTAPRRMYINAKVMSGCQASFRDKDDKVIKYYDGPVPKFMPDEHWGDYVCLDIDLKTGRILNWTATKQAITEFMNDEDNARHFKNPEEE